ncbi:MAG: SRPBCC domain-containing protein [Acidobacteriaceae bacterium]
MSTAAACPRSLVVERVFPHPQEKLWRALTSGSLLEQWMMPNDFAPVVGHKFQFRTEPKPNWDGVVDGEVLLVEPIDRLSYTWGTGGAESGMQWVVEWTLRPNAGGTQVRMEQSGFRPEQKGNYHGAKYGWNKFFEGLERVVAEVDSQ